MGEDLRCLLDQGGEGIKSFPIAMAWIISNASEDAVCAGWESECEHVIWEAVNGVGTWAYELSADGLAALRYLSQETHGWVMWREGVGVVHVSLTEWLPIHEAWKGARR